MEKLGRTCVVIVFTFNSIILGVLYIISCIKLYSLMLNHPIMYSLVERER